MSELSIMRTVFMLATSRTFPNTTCLPSNQSHFVQVTKNWHPLVLGPELAYSYIK
jgi:hypothetical protein